MAALAAQLESIWRREIPLAAALGIEVSGYADGELTVRAALAPNVNLHGTAFAGSLYSIAALAGWGAAWLALRAHALEGQIVLMRAEIQYRRPVAGSIVCKCRFDAALQAQNLDRLRDAGSAVFPLVGTIDAAGRRAVRFAGDYSVKTAAPTPASPQARR